MAEKPEARGTSKKTGDPEKQAAQSARFVAAAREAGVDESGVAFESAMNAMGKSRKS